MQPGEKNEKRQLSLRGRGLSFLGSAFLELCFFGELLADFFEQVFVGEVFIVLWFGIWGCLLLGSSCLAFFGCGDTVFEAFYLAGGIDQHLLATVEGVAVGAKFGLDLGNSAHGVKNRSARGAGDFALDEGWMEFGAHE